MDDYGLPQLSITEIYALNQFQVVGNGSEILGGRFFSIRNTSDSKY